MRTLVQMLAVLALVGLMAGCKAIDNPTTARDEPQAPSAASATQEDATQPESASSDATDQPATGGAGQDASATDAAAVVNGTAIAMDAFRAQALDTQRFYVERGLDPNTEEGQQELLRLRRQVLDDMINQTLIDAAAVDMGIAINDAEVDEAIDKSIAALGGQEKFDQALVESGTTMDDVRAMERAGILGRKVQEQITADLPATAEAVHARHILCETEAACQAVLDRLQAGEDFGAVAAEVSVDKATAERNGDLDWVVRGLLPSRQVEDALFSLPVGQLSSVVQTDFGYHVIEVMEKNPAMALDEEQLNALRQQSLMDWLATQRQNATIVVNVEDLQDVAATN